MNIAEYYTMEKYEKNYWWHRGRLDIVRGQLQKIQAESSKKKLRILNIGCGTGGTVPTLELFGEVFNVDTEPVAIKLLKKNGFKNGQVIKRAKLPFENNYFDVVIAMDVLEHIDAESEALNEWKRVLKKNGQLLITVPAYSWLWSQHDTALHHFRRYNRAQGKVVAEKVGYKIAKRSYMITFSLPLVVAFRWLGKLTKREQTTSYVDLPGPINSLFSYILKIEALVLKYISLPVGTSLLLRVVKK